MRGPLLATFLLAAFITARVAAQGPNPSQSPAAQARSQIFSGYVAAMNGNSMTVTRKGVAGKDLVSKIFVMDPQTKIEGHLKLNARVTVRFDASGDANRAIRIIVRG